MVCVVRCKCVGVDVWATHIIVDIVFVCMVVAVVVVAVVGVSVAVVVVVLVCPEWALAGSCCCRM